MDKKYLDRLLRKRWQIDDEIERISKPSAFDIALNELPENMAKAFKDVGATATPSTLVQRLRILSGGCDCPHCRIAREAADAHEALVQALTELRGEYLELYGCYPPPYMTQGNMLRRIDKALATLSQPASQEDSNG